MVLEGGSMFVAKVVYLTVVDLPEEFDNLSSTVYEGNDGAYYEVELDENREAVFSLFTMGILDEEEANELINEGVEYAMIWVPA